MYTRDFGNQESEKTVPDSYCGNLFREESDVGLHNEIKDEEKSTEASIFRSLLGKPFDLKSIALFKNGIGTEEILIIGIAAFLLFSKDGDKECAIILLLSLFFF